MSAESDSESTVDASVAKGRSLPWGLLILTTLYWVAYLIFESIELTMFNRFLAKASTLLILLMGFTVWWVARGPLSLKARWLVVGWMVLCGVLTGFLIHRTVVLPAVLFLALPVLLTAWTLWLLISQSSTERKRLVGMLIMPPLVLLPGLLVRMEGMKGDGAGDFHWRWSRSSEEQFLEALTSDAPTEPLEQKPLSINASKTDWIGFRGPHRNAVRPGVKITTNWSEKPPTLLWRNRVGPAWSSIVVVGEQLFTQEQRGEKEVVSCYDVKTGKPIWVHEDAGRFEESLGGVGPRATPTFAAGRLYALGAAGRLNCLDAATGEVVWSHDIGVDAAVKPPTWGFAGSPLVVDGRVIVFAGGAKNKALIAYDAATGETDWTAAAGVESYSSPQLVSLDGKSQVLFLGGDQLGAFDPESGDLLWSYQPSHSGQRPNIQPRQIDDSTLLVSFSPDEGAVCIAVTREDDRWNVVERWATRSMKPDFSDWVHHGEYVYGFDGSIFCCINLAAGDREWKGGRYGAGQVLLLPDQDLLFVITENGEGVLVAADPRRLDELARFQAVRGKTWNHPVIADGKLFVRNAEEMACYQLSLADD